MSLMRRFRDLTVATLNDRLENAQDPIRVIDSFLRDMNDAIKETESLYRQYTAHTAGVRTQYLQSDALARKREEQAMLAVKAGEDELARAALAEKVLEEEKRNGYHELYEQSQRAVEELEHQLRDLKREYQEVYHKRQYYLARMESLKLQQRMQDRARSFGNQGENWFQRLEDRITDLELETRSLLEIRGGGAGTRNGGGSFYVEDKIDQALAMLKKKLEGSDGTR